MQTLLLLSSTSELNLGTTAMGLLGGLALFLFGIEQMTDALKILAGDGMKNLLARLTTNRFKAATAGAVVTAVIQSSSVTTVLVVGFVSAGLMSLSQSVGVIMGANIGTTITAQIIAFKVTKYALLLIAFGFALLFCSKNERLRHYGHMIMGLGMIFFGMQVMSTSTSDLQNYEPFLDLLKRMDNPLPGVLVGAAFTALIQSSSATTGVIIMLASGGFIGLEAGIALAFGANIGTCVTALLAAIGKPREAVQAAVVHVLFNTLGVVVWIALIDELATAVRWFSPTANELVGTAKLAAETPRQIANAHTLFNVANTLLFLGFTTPLAALVERIVPRRVQAEPEVMRPKYLDDILLQTPALAMDVVRMELGRLGAAALNLVEKGLDVVMHGSPQALDELRRMDDDVDALHASIVTYLGRLSQQQISDAQSEQLHDYLAAANNIESIGDMVETNLVHAGKERLKQKLRFSASTRELLVALHGRVCAEVERSIKTLVDADEALAGEVLRAKDEISRLADNAENHLARRLTAEEPNRLAAFRVESELIEYLKRVYYFAKRIAKDVAEKEKSGGEIEAEGAAEVVAGE